MSKPIIEVDLYQYFHHEFFYEVQYEDILDAQAIWRAMHA